MDNPARDNPLIRRMMQLKEAQVFTGGSNEGSVLAGIVKDALAANAHLQENAIGQTREDLKTQAAELREYRDRLTSPGESPIDTYLKMREALTGMAGDLLKQMGYSGQNQALVQASDLPRAIELEGLKLERDEAQRRWQTEQDEKKHQWDVDREERNRRYEIEDRQWKSEFDFRREQQDFENKRRDNTSTLLQDAVRSISASIDINRNEAAASQPAETPPQVVSEPITSFKCQSCGEMVQVDDPNTREATCAKCGMQYQFEEINAK